MDIQVILNEMIIGIGNYIQITNVDKFQKYICINHIKLNIDIKLININSLTIEIYIKNKEYRVFDFNDVTKIDYDTLNEKLQLKCNGKYHMFYKQKVIDIINDWENNIKTDWRGTTDSFKKSWLGASLYWTGLPKKLGKENYVLDLSCVKTSDDFFCYLGETFFGYRGYFGQDTDGFEDCFCELTILNKPKVIVLNYKNFIRNDEILFNSFIEISQTYFDLHIQP